MLQRAWEMRWQARRPRFFVIELETGANALPRHSINELLDAIYASAVVPAGENAKSAGPGATSMDASSFPCESNAARGRIGFQQSESTRRMLR